jgi:hypothetical protein
MKTFSFKSDKKGLADALMKAKAIAPQIAALFAAPGFFKEHKDIEKACADAGINIVGCSTAGEISADGVSDDSFSVVAMHFDATEVKVARAQVTGAESSRQAGRRIGQDLAAPDLTSIFVLSPGLNVNGSELVRGISDAVGKNVVITGGLAGDGTTFGMTHTLLNGHVYQDHAVAFGLYGDRVRVKSGSRGGWKPFGPVRRVTRATGNVLYELDGKPALKLYKEYLGDKAAGLPASGLLYPFAILREEDRQETGLIRTILDVDHKAESLTMAGDLPQGSLVSLMYADTDSLVDGAGEAAEEASMKGRQGNSATLLVSCVGRKIIMGGSVDEEVEAVMQAIGKNSAFAGFYSYGEICPFSETGFSELHNQTMTITHISEEDKAA